jgi:NAD(P)-dependent dehydrogenase (short-subunit alcohol dehydrogenase family)
MENTFRTNVISFFWMTHVAVKHMKAGDVIINSGSVVALMPYPQLTDHRASKAAIHKMTKNMAVALARRGFGSTAWRLGRCGPTPLIASTRDEQFVGEFGGDSLWKRPAQPAELAPSYVFLASTDSRYYTGEVLCPSRYPITSR